MKKVNLEQSKIVNDIIKLIEDNEQGDIISIYHALNIEFDRQKKRLYIKRYTKSFKIVDGLLKRLPCYIPVFKIENENFIIHNEVYLQGILYLIKDYYSNVEKINYF